MAGFIWSDESTGWRHLYLYDRNGRKVRAITRGLYPVKGLSGVDEATGEVFFTASMRDGRELPIEQQLFHASLKRTVTPVAVTPGGGWWGVSMNRTATAYVGNYSDPATPPRSGLYHADGTFVRWIEENRLDASHPFAPYVSRLPVVDYGTLPSHGETLVWRMTKPVGFDPAKRYPVVMQVYGGPGTGAGVTRSWQPVTNQLLNEAGYIVFRLDNRGEGDRSQANGSAQYRRMGTPEIEDQVIAANYLRSLPYVDPARMAMMGWSYGGFMSLMAVTEPKMGLAAVAAGGPPTNWSLYDTHYTERYMSTPQDNVAGYAASDVTTRLDHMTGRLLLMHGMADDNVVFENSTRLMDALQARSIPFELMLYPGQRHGVRGNERQLQQWRTYLDFLRQNDRVKVAEPMTSTRRSAWVGCLVLAAVATKGAAAQTSTSRPDDTRTHSVIVWNATAAQTARTPGSIRGLPILLKDNIETLDMPTTAGSLALADNAPGRDAPLVARLRAAGAVILGKTNLSEWANIRSSNSISGWSAVGGQTLNPYDPTRTPCGSSSGSAAAVAIGLAPAAIGTETDGSITCPAAVNGLVGFKPTVGLVSRTHIVPISHSQDTAGPITTTVEDAAIVLNAIAGSDPADAATVEADGRKVDYRAALDANALRGARIGVMRFSKGYSDETMAVFEQNLQALRDAGAVLIDIDDGPDEEAIGKAELTVLLVELKADLNAYLDTTDPTQVATRTLADVIAFNAATPAETVLFGQELFIQAEATKGLDDPDYLKARADSLRMAGAEGIDRMMREHQLIALIAPTTSRAWTNDPKDDDESMGSSTSLPAIAGYPHLTVPMGFDRGMPVGLSFIGGRWDDARILSLGYAFEQQTHARRAPGRLGATASE